MEYNELYQATLAMLKERGVDLDEIAELVLDLQKPYLPKLTLEDARDSVDAVLEKREVQNAILTGIYLDIASEKGDVDEPLQSLLLTDDPLYGVDEILALSIVNIYGSIGLTNFGYLDKEKPGVIDKINKEKGGKVNTFLDDLICAIAASSASRIAHRARDGEFDRD
ncbi:phosphatidylglycerophosphatase A [Natranaerobius thermophilus]|uniref:Phosphatidylglycerophosphatase A n=1 Tax=Natranaerobius thermophilus (strain ATCC BAA-1301 / DSM 18059 / JW/NM-WN-LF) TaxID=457570 RepID=B2A3S8_NATTJ|nr:phosphatidylglycerophosphatase A [Natranaerobius thermophilus]ACB83704.1 phosphatidylglycerophosphatase A [Natranaerobius thermophilus JW/NM-WN-LF]